MALAESWHVRSRSRECAATQRAFIDGETIVTALFPDPESSGYVRRDFCLDAWQNLPEDAEKPFSFWKTNFSGPTTSGAVEPVERLSPEEILVRLVEEDEDHTENTRYILAVMLERQKILRETDSQRTPNGILRVYEHRKTGEVYLIRDPDIPLSQVESVQNEVFILLENNGRTPEPVLEEAPAEIPAEEPVASETVAEEENISAEAEDPAPSNDIEPDEIPDDSEEE
jgi:hypothetical protein